MKKTVKLSAELLEELIQASSALNVKKNVMEIMASVGTDLTTPGGVAYIETVVEASAAYTQLFHQASLEAEAAGYDPAVDGKMTLMTTQGVISWGEEEAPAVADQEEGEGHGD